MIESFLISILAGITTEKGLSWLQNTFDNNKGIGGKIEDAFERALKKWSVNKDIQRKELLLIQNRTTLLSKIVTGYKTEPIKSGIKELLDLFQQEIMSDSVAYNLLIEFHNQASIERNNRIESKLDILLRFYDESFSMKKDELTTAELISLNEEKKGIQTTHFISNLEKEPLYIPRYLRNSNRADSVDEISITLEQLIYDHSKIVLLGNAGIGKSVELKETAFKIAEKNNYFPIFINLNIYDPNEKLESILPREWTTIATEKVILLFDGFDEIEQDCVCKAKKQILCFTQEYPSIRMIISCRTNFYSVPNNTYGTVKDFKPFYLNALSNDDLKCFIRKNYHFDAEKFLLKVDKRGFSDLAKNPFYLNLLINNYRNNDNNLSTRRSELFKSVIEETFDFNEDKFQETIDISDLKYSIEANLQKIALVMETADKRNIYDEELKKELLSEKEIKDIKYSSLFKKGEELHPLPKIEKMLSEMWKFEHNSFQEFLSAELLANYSFQEIKQFISHPNIDRVLPIWFNTVINLMSIVKISSETFNQLTSWLSKNDPEILINTEKELLSEDQRANIFIAICKYYNQKKIWIKSNKFTLSDLSQFGGNEATYSFLLKEIANTENDRIVRLNCLHVLCDPNLSEYPNKQSLKSFLFDLINEQIDDSYYVFLAIHSLCYAEIVDSESTKELFGIIGKSKAQYIRAAMYKYLKHSYDFEKYIEYYIEGYKLLREGVNTEGRDDVNLTDESWNLREGIKSFKSPETLFSIFNFCSTDNDIERDYKSHEIFEAFVSNTVGAYAGNEELFNAILNLVKHYSKGWNKKEINSLRSFFEQTKTKQKAFNEILNSIDNESNNSWESDLLTLFIDTNNISQVTNAVREGKLNPNFAERLYRDIKSESPSIASIYKDEIEKQTDITIYVPKQFDWNSFNKEKKQKSFDLFFDYESFKTECLKVFEQKNELTWDEIWEYKNIREEDIENENTIIDSALDFVLDFARNNNTVKKSDVENWFKGEFHFRDNTIFDITQIIKNQNDILVTTEQQNYLQNWFNEFITKIDFTKAIRHKEDGTISINNYACHLAYMLKRFEFECTEPVLLDMLSFAVLDDTMQTVEFDYICERIKDKNKINQRVIRNLENRDIQDFMVYEAHIQHALKNKLKKTYQVIFDDLVENRFDTYHQRRVLNCFFSVGNDFSLLKDSYDNFSIELKLHFIEKLLTNEDFEYCIQKLQLMRESETDISIIRTINNHLITANCIDGLKYSIDWIKTHKICPFSQIGKGLTHFEDIEALDYLIELLELSYDKSIKIGHPLDQMWPIVVNGLEHLALASSKNYETVTERMAKFINDNKAKYEHVEFLNTSLENIKENFYKNYTITYTIKQAKEKVENLLNPQQAQVINTINIERQINQGDHSSYYEN